MSLKSLSNHTADFQTQTQTKDANGGVSAGGWSNSVVGWSCTVQPQHDAKVIERLAKAGIECSHVAYGATLPSPLAVGDRLVFSGAKYQVAGWEDQAGRGKVYAVFLNQLVA